MSGAARDHGGGLDAAVARYGGRRADWIDLSTGINRVPYPSGHVGSESWTALPDATALHRLEAAARLFWGVPDTASLVAAPGASSLIVRLPELAPPGRVLIPGPTYNEHAAAFCMQGREVVEEGSAPVAVLVHPNNPDGRLWSLDEVSEQRLTIIDESFCDTLPARSHVALTDRPGTIVLKSFGKFWGLAGVRLGFAIGHPETLADLAERLGPWAVSGPALEIGARALEDIGWADETRERLEDDARRLDELAADRGATVMGGTSLFRLIETAEGRAWQDALARHRIWSRVFPWSGRLLRLGLPAPSEWARVEEALADVPGRT
ncbi:threonine-phosphate decarboxylase [Histidinibacterium aquaticum]|uniref:Pyridoxal phosphate-dependent class II aminotransferase n=1 Tax=Histidinibacterium aquaticum TaxID=2613962 RepID=A0A5J5GFT0_9RHOB|nr:threonine-phosphate decarboxylase [Histidinibacterium aquaticum]KAA9007045.1 pyridoxal phosphate-dependent class II aminotransferase [Histidinibacterium aquaticum]